MQSDNNRKKAGGGWRNISSIMSVLSKCDISDPVSIVP